MSTLKEALQSDLTTAIKARDEVVAATLRMTLAAVTNAEVAGKQARTLADDELLAVIVKEAKKRKEAAEAYVAAARPELAEREQAELAVLERYLPQALSPAELQELIKGAIEEARTAGLEGMKAMGVVMKSLGPKVSGRSDGGAVAAEVKRLLGPGGAR